MQDVHLFLQYEKTLFANTNCTIIDFQEDFNLQLLLRFHLLILLVSKNHSSSLY